MSYYDALWCLILVEHNNNSLNLNFVKMNAYLLVLMHNCKGWACLNLNGCLYICPPDVDNFDYNVPLKGILWNSQI